MTSNNPISNFDFSTTGDPPENEILLVHSIKEKFKSPDISLEKKLTIYNRIKFLIENGQWHHRQVHQIHLDYNVGKSSVYRLVRKVKVDIVQDVHEIPDLAAKRKGKCGTKPTWTTPYISAKLL